MNGVPYIICVTLVTLDKREGRVYSDTMAKKKKSFVPCQFCTSKYRYQIEQAIQNDVNRSQIAEKYMPLTGHTKETSFKRAVERHMQKDHFKFAKKMPYFDAPPGSEHKMSATSLEGLAQGLMDIGGGIVDYYQKNPLVARKELKIGEIMKAQDSVTNRMKVQVTQDALKLQMAKMFGGFIGDTVDAQEGEIVDAESPTALLTED